MKTTKKQLVKELEEILVKVVAKQQSDEFAKLIEDTINVYNVKPKEVSMTELKELLSEAKEFVGDIVSEEKGAEQLLAILDGDNVPVETSPKKITKKEETKKTVIKKPTVKKTTDTKEEKQEPVKKVSPSDKLFPPTIKVEGIDPMKKVGDITIKDLAEMGEKSSVYVAMYWDKKALKKYDYDQAGILSEAPKSFPYDLDVCQILYIGDSKNLVYAISIYTEVMYILTLDDFERVDGFMYSNGAEFEIYQ